MAALARELSRRGERVLATTTTKMALEEADGPWRVRTVAGADDLLACADAGPILACGGIDRARERLIGLLPEAIDALATSDRFTRIIVEADGAARKPLKAPGPHEPVFPRTADAVVIVAGASGLGQPLEEGTVFRAAEWSRLTGLEPLAPVTPDSLAQMVVHPAGLAKGAPAAARRMLFINQADTAERVTAAERVVDSLLGASGLVPDRSVVGQLEPAPAIRLVRMREHGCEARP
jgi:probable selenium-dependent hydroxylase accessory protein YqeC